MRTGHPLGQRRLLVGVGQFDRISAYGDAVCARYTNGRLRCWGDERIVDNIPDETFIRFDLDTNFACGVTEAGNIRCWGYRGPALDSPSDDFGPFLDVSTTNGNGAGASCALDVEGNLRCWGANAEANASENCTPVGGDAVRLWLRKQHWCSKIMISADGQLLPWPD